MPEINWAMTIVVGCGVSFFISTIVAISFAVVRSKQNHTPFDLIGWCVLFKLATTGTFFTSLAVYVIHRGFTVMPTFLQVLFILAATGAWALTFAVVADRPISIISSKPGEQHAGSNG